MKIAILDDYQDTIRTLNAFKKMAGQDVTIWKDHTKDVDTLAARLKDTEVLVLLRERTPIRGPLLDRLDRLRMITQVGVVPNIDVPACTKRGVIVSSSQMPGRPSYATAELTWGLVIAAVRRIPQEMIAMRAGKWQAFPIGTGLRGKTLGILGYGKIGAVVAGYGRAFGMNVLAWGRESTLEKAKADGYTPAASREAFFAESDVVSIHVRLIDATRGMVTADDFARMKPSAVFVNTSRAGLVVPGALEAALAKGRPGMAAVDVYEDEPVMGAKHPLLAMDNAICVPHLGYVELDGLEHMYDTIFDQVLAYARRQADQRAESGGRGDRQVMSIRDKAYIVGVFEHPTRKADDNSLAQLHAEVGARRARRTRASPRTTSTATSARATRRAWAGSRWPTTWACGCGTSTPPRPAGRPTWSTSPTPRRRSRRGAATWR